MRKFLLSAGAVVGILGATSLAAAADTGGVAGKGSFFISAERVFGLQIHSATSESTAGATTTKNTESHTDFGLLVGNPQGGPYNIPQLGFDFAVIDSLTIGGAIGFWTGGSKQKTEQTSQPTVERDGPTFNAFKLSPRVGYIIGLNDSMGIWLRGGFTFFNFGSTSESTSAGGVISKRTDSQNGFALNLEPGFLLMVNPHFGFGANINVDIPLSGKLKSERTTGGTTTSTEFDYKELNFGLTFGIVGKI